MDKVHVIVNPHSACGRTGRRWQSIREAIRQAFREFKWVFTEKPLQATQLAREMLRDGYDLIIGVGGDGTLHEIANGFFQDAQGGVINEDAALALVPSGTGSDFVRSQHVPRDFRRAALHIRNAPARRFDVGRIRFLPPGDSAISRYFVNVADFGLGAEVISHLQRTTPQKRTPLTYYRGLLSTLMRFRAPEVTVAGDEGFAYRGRCLIGAVANGPIFGGGMIIAPRALPDDGSFDVTLVREMGRLEIVANTPRLYRGTIDRHPKVTVARARRLRVDSTENVAVECDGELCGRLPAEFELLPRSLNFRI